MPIINKVSYDGHDSFRVACDYCGFQCPRSGIEPGDASELARKWGFETVRSRTIGDPLSWKCKNAACQAMTERDTIYHETAQAKKAQS